MRRSFLLLWHMFCFVWAVFAECTFCFCCLYCLLQSIFRLLLPPSCYVGELPPLSSRVSSTFLFNRPTARPAWLVLLCLCHRVQQQVIHAKRKLWHGNVPLFRWCFSFLYLPAIACAFSALSWEVPALCNCSLVEHTLSRNTGAVIITHRALPCRYSKHAMGVVCRPSQLLYAIFIE